MKPMKSVKVSIILCIMCFIVGTIRAPMIVVQGAIQLWPVTIINESGMTLVVNDEIIDPHGSSVITRTLPSITPNNQFTFQWPSTFEKPNARKITIYGKLYAVLRTHKLVIGNTPDATHPMVPSGDFTIVRQSRLGLCVEDKLNKGQCAGR
jgi:hypothetical protein